jgi:hypothetical protein
MVYQVGYKLAPENVNQAILEDKKRVQGGLKTSREKAQDRHF